MAKPAAPDHVEKFVWDTFPPIIKKPKKKLDLGNEHSGNYGHAGRPGEVGGSAPGDASSHDRLIETPNGKFRDADHEAAYLAQKANNAKAASDAALVAEMAPGGRFETEAKRIDAQQHAERRLQFLSKGTNAVITVPTPQLIRTAEQTADVLEEMKEQGLRMPDTIVIGRTHSKNPHAQIMGLGGQMHLEVSIPENLPDHVSLDDAVAAVFGEKVPTTNPRHGRMNDVVKLTPMQEKAVETHPDPKHDTYDRYTAKTMHDVIVHEMGHVQAGHREELDMQDLVLGHGGRPAHFKSVLDVRRAMLRVSVYAGTNANEFLAESFTRLYRGETLDEDSMKLYRILNGPPLGWDREFGGKK